MKNKMNNMNNSDARLEVRLGQSLSEAIQGMRIDAAKTGKDVDGDSVIGYLYEQDKKGQLYEAIHGMSIGKIAVDGKSDMSMYAGLDYDNMGAVVSRYPMVSMNECISLAVNEGLHDADVAHAGMYGNDIDGDYEYGACVEYDEYANSKAFDDARYEASMAALCIKHGYIKVEGGYIPKPVSNVRSCETCVNGSGEYFENHCCCEAWNYIGECNYEAYDCIKCAHNDYCHIGTCNKGECPF